MKLLKIKSIVKEKYCGKIYDLEIKNSHTYNIENIIVGNCAGGLHGIGLKAINALSDLFTVAVKRDGNVYQQKFSKGKSLTKVEIVDKCDINDTGTKIQYHPDSEIFTQTLEPNETQLISRLEEIVSLNAGLKVEYKNELTKTERTLCNEDGIKGLAKFLIKDNTSLYEEVFYIKDTYNVDENKAIIVEIAFLHDNAVEPHETIRTFANNINTYEGGFHLNGFRDGYKKVMNDFAVQEGLTKSVIELRYLLDGIYAIISVKVPEAEFEGQTKTKLGNQEVETAVEEVMAKAFNDLYKTRKDDLKILIDKALKSKEAEEAARKARQNVRAANKATKTALPGKLADCANKAGYKELYIVEGDSAGGSAKSGRFPQFQAILPLRGKILNVEKSDFERLLKSDTIKNIMAAIGCGIGKEFNIKKCRYDKIIIMADADDDGGHIAILLLTFFYNYMRPLIEEGYIFIALPPLYRIVTNKGSKYFLNDSELNKYRKSVKNIGEVQRFKGLGEMDSDQLRETTMSPKTRTLKKIQIRDAEETANIVEMLMGENVTCRRQFIEENAHLVELNNL